MHQARNYYLHCLVTPWRPYKINTCRYLQICQLLLETRADDGGEVHLVKIRILRELPSSRLSCSCRMMQHHT